jgi:hypothetical protein
VLDQTFQLQALTIPRMSEQDAQEHSHEGASEVQTVTYAEGYDDPKANVVILALADKKSLRVHDYYLKASR